MNVGLHLISVPTFTPNMNFYTKEARNDEFFYCSTKEKKLDEIYIFQREEKIKEDIIYSIGWKKIRFYKKYLTNWINFKKSG